MGPSFFPFFIAQYLRSGFTALLLFILLTPQVNHAAQKQSVCKKCNVLLLNIDFLRSDYVGSHSGSSLTPNIDNFFTEGLVYRNIYSPSGSTYRGNLSVFTATNPFFYHLDVKTFESLRSKPGFRHWKNIYTSQTTLAEHMQAAGYYTAMSNKGTRSGKRTMLGRGYNTYRQFPIRVLIEDQIDHLVELLESTPEPYFIHFHAVPTRLHRAFYPRDREQIKDKNIIYIPYKFDNKNYGYKIIRNHGATKEEQRQAEHTIYRQQLKYADEQLKRIFDNLSGRMENTIVILVSTHGTQIGDKGIFASNGVSYESNIRVPLMIRLPGTRINKVVNDRLSLIDLVPSILKLLNLPIDMTERNDFFSMHTNDRHYQRPFIAGHNDKDSYIIRGDWKLFLKTSTERKLYRLLDGKISGGNIYNRNKMLALKMETSVNQGFDLNIELQENGYLFSKRTLETPELYKLSQDPLENNNLAAGNPQITNELTDLLHQYQQEAKSKIDDLNLD
ncbi:MAG: sulfatase-like hydrolase/transferase [Gammaproteobacteria bacterium]|nr:sulfatase-like hydrolase/transferase [Gammaproteobacteria bacterium]